MPELFHKPGSSLKSGTQENNRAKLARAAARLNSRNRSKTVPPLILMTDDNHQVDWIGAAQALPPGAGIIVRSKYPKTRARLAKELLPIARRRRLKLFIAADWKMAFRLRADGIHCPEGQTAIAPGLKNLHPKWIITAAAHGQRGTTTARLKRADAALLSPAFPTQSHPNGNTLGLLRWGQIQQSTKISLIALGGINAANIQRMASLNICGVALISGWL